MSKPVVTNGKFDESVVTTDTLEIQQVNHSSKRKFSHRSNRDVP